MLNNTKNSFLLAFLFISILGSTQASQYSIDDILSIENDSTYHCNLAERNLTAIPILTDYADKISSLDLSDNPYLSNSSLAGLSQFRNLKSLSLANDSFDDTGIAFVVKLVPGLKYFDVSGCSRITSVGYGYLSKLQLETLVADHNPLRTCGIQEICRYLPNLSSLSVKSCGMGDDALPTLLGMHRLGYLNVIGNTFDSEKGRAFQESIAGRQVKLLMDSER